MDFTPLFFDCPEVLPSSKTALSRYVCTFIDATQYHHCNLSSGKPAHPALPAEHKRSACSTSLTMSRGPNSMTEAATIMYRSSRGSLEDQASGLVVSRMVIFNFGSSAHSRNMLHHPLKTKDLPIWEWSADGVVGFEFDDSLGLRRLHSIRRLY